MPQTVGAFELRLGGPDVLTSGLERSPNTSLPGYGSLTPDWSRSPQPSLGQRTNALRALRMPVSVLFIALGHSQSEFLRYVTKFCY